MYWWNLASLQLQEHRCKRFGLITTNSISQPYSRKLIQKRLTGKSALNLVFVVPDHPWVDSADGADVRVAMTVVTRDETVGELLEITEEASGREDAVVKFSKRSGRIGPDLTVGPSMGDVMPLKANAELCSVGYQLSGRGFMLSNPQKEALVGRNYEANMVVRPLLSARDIAQKSRDMFAIDLCGLEEREIRQRYPEIYQWILDHVKPEREVNCEPRFQEKWWSFSRPREDFRKALRGINRMLVTPLTAKHRYFISIDSDVIADSTCVLFACEDMYISGVLNSNIHTHFASRVGGNLGVGNDERYLKASCFDPFPFPDATEAQRGRIRELGEQLDAHRKARQAAHPKLTMTGMYNVLAKLRMGLELTPKEREIHAQGLVSVLRELHDTLDAAVCAAYGWPVSLSDEDILARLVALNAERAEEERQGQIRWLRPEFQCPPAATATETQAPLDGTEEAISPPGGRVSSRAGSEDAIGPPSKGDQAGRPGGRVSPRAGSEIAVEVASKEKRPWPKTLPAQAQALREVLATLNRPASPEELARLFQRANRARVAEILETLASLGQCREVEAGRYGG